MPGNNFSHGIGALILGAGFARRFGADKRLALLDTEPVALHTVRRYTQVFSQVRVVIRPEDDALQALLAPTGAELICAPDANLGMGHSLRAGIEGVSWQWAFVALLDMPYVQPRTLQQLAEHAQAQSAACIIRPRFTPDPMAQAHPIGFHEYYFPQLARASGDRGARELLHKAAAQTQWLDTDDPGVVRDIDTPDDLVPINR